MSDIQTELTRIKNAKSSIISALEGLGIEVPDGTLLDGLPSIISQLASDSTVQVTLSLEGVGEIYEAKYTGEAPESVVDTLELVVPSDREYPSNDVALDENCLGAYSGKAKKVVIPKEVTTLYEKCISDTTVTEIDINSNSASLDEYKWAYGSFFGCTNLTKVLFNGVEVSFEDLIEDPDA